jgi:hypothetical protein
MVQHEMIIGLVIERLAPSSPWGEPIWLPVQALAGVPDTAPWTVLGRSSDRVTYYAGAFAITLYSTDTALYRDNLMADRPKLWVGMQPDGPEPPMEGITVTADPAEGEGMTQTGTCIVEAIDMPGWIAAEVAAFVEAHHVEREFVKRKRDKRPPEMVGRRGMPGRSEK